MRGFLAGTLALIILDALLSGKAPTETSGLLGWASDALSDFLSPDHPGLPKVKAATSAANSSYTTPVATATPVPGANTGVSALSV